MFALCVRTRTIVLRYHAMRKLQTAETVKRKAQISCRHRQFHYDRQLCYDKRVAKRVGDMFDGQPRGRCDEQNDPRRI